MNVIVDHVKDSLSIATEFDVKYIYGRPHKQCAVGFVLNELYRSMNATQACVISYVLYICGCIVDTGR